MASYAPKNFDIAIKKIEGELRQVFAKRIGDYVEELQDRILARTPVQTGQVAANFQVTAGRPYGGVIGPPGPKTPGTSQMALGSEPNRERAEAIARGSFSRALFRSPYQIFYITNNAPHVLALEYGEAPTPETTRAPAGMVGISVAEMRK